MLLLLMMMPLLLEVIDKAILYKELGKWKVLQNDNNCCRTLSIPLFSQQIRFRSHFHPL